MSAPSAKRCFPPIIGENARVLILGTLPGEASLTLGQYYGHPRNHFWPIIARVVGRALPESYPDRVAMLTSARLALWDVIASADRTDSSLDSDIRNPQVNDFTALFRAHPSLTAIAFNGQPAHKFYRQHATRPSGAPHGKRSLIVLPSTSPAYARPLDEKADRWHEALRVALRD